MKIEFLLVKPENSKCNSVKTIKNLLGSDSSLIVDGKLIKLGPFSCNYEVKTDLVEDEKDERYFSFVLGSTTLDEEKSVETLIEIFRKIKSVLLESGNSFRIAVLWDDTSFYFSKKSYPLIFEIENLMRKLIYKFMLTKLGTDWFKSAVPAEFKNSVSDSSKQREKANKFFESVLYNADFIHIILFLFRPYTTNTDSIIAKIGKAKTIDELDLQSLKLLAPQDNWTRFFAPLIQHDSFKERWETLYSLRCKVAHNTLIDKGEYEQIIELTSELRGKLENAISSLDKIKMNEDDRKDLSNSAFQSLIDFSTLYKNENANDYFNLWAIDHIIPATNWSKKISDYLNDEIGEKHFSNLIYHSITGINTQSVRDSFSRKNKKCKGCGKKIESDVTGTFHDYCDECMGDESGMTVLAQ